ncbi:MAG: hypothetical protein ACRDIY_19060 [Chloroflexota bacterium]
MAIERGVPDWHGIRAALIALSWGSGLTREEMKNQSAALRATSVVDLLPPEFVFPGAGSVISYFEQIQREGRIELAELEPPQGYTDRSTTGLTVPAYRYPPSVGGGYGSGNTGSSAQTGKGREGTSDREWWT